MRDTGRPVPRLVLVDGPPGSGKSTIAHALAQDRPLTLALDLDAAALAKRLAARAADPDRSEHAVNNRLVGPEDADALVRTIEPLREARPRARYVDEAGSLPATLDLVRAAIGDPEH